LVVSRVMQGTNMKFPRRNFLCLAAGIAALPAMPRMAAAQGYPPHPMTLIVPYPAGGGADAVARVIAEGMRAFLGQPIIIENVGGAGGSTGTGRVARAPPDGYTLGMGNWSTHVVNAAVSALPYDVVNDSSRCHCSSDFLGACCEERAASEQPGGSDCLAEGEIPECSGFLPVRNRHHLTATGRTPL
jgi:Tripartite tricarboxylate transporter family receptor